MQDRCSQELFINSFVGFSKKTRKKGDLRMDISALKSVSDFAFDCENKVFSFFFQITVIQDLADVPAMALILTSLVFIWLFPKGIYNETHDFLVT